MIQGAEDNLSDRKVIQCNYADGTKIARAGARAYVVLPNPGNGHDRIKILVRSRNGRWVEKYEDIQRLTNFRVKALPSEHPLYSSDQLWDFEPGRHVVELTAAHKRQAEGQS